MEITLKHEGKEYTLTFTRDSVKRLERDGFRLDDIDTLPVNRISQFVKGAFFANHPDISDELCDEIYLGIGKKRDFLFALAKMYNATVEPFFDNKGNANWTLKD